MGRHLEPGRLSAWASQVSLASLGGRTVDEAITDGVGFRQIWLAVWEMLELPEAER